MRRLLTTGLTLWLAIALQTTTLHAKTLIERSPARLESLAREARPRLMTDPRSAWFKAQELGRLAESFQNERQKTQYTATAAWLSGEALWRLGQLSEAEVAIRKARKFASIAGLDNSALMGDIIMTSGNVSAAKVEVAKALHSFHQAHQIFARTGDRRGQAIVLVCISMLYADAKDHASALRYIDQALEAHSADPKLELSIRNNRGVTFAALDRHAEAARQFRRALSIARRMDSPALEGQVLRNMLRAELAQGRLQAAATTAAKIMAIAQVAGEAERPAMLSAVAQLAFQRGELAQAVALINQSFGGVDLTKSTMPMREGHATAYRIYRAVGNAPMALAHLDALKRLDDEAAKLATQTSVALMGARFDYANQELRIARLRAEELQRAIRHERETAEFRSMLFAGAAAAALIVLALLSFGLFTIRRSRNQVRAAHDDLAVTNIALGEALTAKTEFLATTSHEIRTPLNGILGMTEVMLLDRTLPDGARERMRLVHGAGKTMKALIDDILDMAKIERGGLSLESVAFDLKEVLGDAARLWEDQIVAKGVAFDVKLDLPDNRVLGDPARLRQIAFNLLSNAAKFTETGSITFSAQDDRAGLCRIAVQDTGVGIPEGKQDQIFDLFRQADASVTRRFGGTGLGLSISRSLARAMGGDLAVRSQVGIGSTFTLTVPLAPCGEEAQAREIDRTDAVLIVDGNPVMRAMLRSLVAPHAAAVLAVGTVEEALAIVEDCAPAVMLIDEGGCTGDLDRALMAAGRRCGSRLVLLRSEAAESRPSDEPSITTVCKPVSGPALLAAMFPAPVDEEYIESLVSRAA